jgi:phosphatidylinositol alpha-mannosyltransferase
MSQKKLVIVFLYDGMLKPSEGVPNYILSLGDYYTIKGHDVYYLVGQTEIVTDKIIALTHTVSVKFNGNKVETPMLASMQKIRSALDKTKPDIIHLQMPYSPMMAGRVIKIASKRHIPIIGTFHTYPETKHVIIGSKLLNILNYRSKKYIDNVVSVSEVARQFCLNAFKFSSDVLPCPIDLEKFSSATRMQKYADDKLNIVFMGRLVERKGCEYLLRAIAILSDIDKNRIRLLIGGNGPLKTRLIKLAQDLGIEKYIHFLGYIQEEDKANFLASADIAVFPSIGGESFGIMIVEAMAAEAGVVLGGNNVGYSAVLNNNPELLFGSSDYKQLSEMLNKLINDKNKRIELHRYQQNLIKQYDINLVGPKLLKKYFDLVYTFNHD